MKNHVVSVSFVGRRYANNLSGCVAADRVVVTKGF